MGSAVTFSIANEFSEVVRLPQHCYGAYDPSPVVSSRTCLASSANEPGTSTSLGPAARKSGASKPNARCISEGIPASLSTPSISSAIDSSGAAATFTHLSTIHASYPRLFTDALRSGVLGNAYCPELALMSASALALRNYHIDTRRWLCPTVPP